MTINTLGTSGLWYTATILPMTNWVHTRVTKAIYDFLWNGKTEQVKRDTCQLPFAQSGLPVINPLEKARAVKLRWVPRIGDPTCESKWVYFARFWIGFALSRLIRSWSFLRSNSVTKYIGNSPPMYFRHILTAIAQLNIDITLLPDYSIKTFYKKLVYPSPRSLSCTAAWERRLEHPLPWSILWPNIYGGLSTNWESDIAWRLAHGIVKTTAYLKRWQRLQVSDRCAICGQIESFSHALCECTLAPAVWAWIFSITNNLYANTVGFSPPLVLLKHRLPTGAQHARSNAVTRFLINLALNEIWATRNLHTLEGKPSTASLVINKIK